MAKSRDEFSLKTKHALAARAGNVCSFPGCTQHTSGPSAEAPDASVNLGEAAHISGAASGPGSRRYDPAMTSADRSSINNGIWLCRTHAKLIDSDEATYTVEQLQQLKLEATARADQRMCSGAEKKTEPLVHEISGAERVLVAGHVENIRMGENPPAEAPTLHWNVPNQNKYFTGREDLLKELEERLKAAGTAALTQAITGLGGVGKTQVASEFCHRHSKKYDAGVYWADASSADTLLYSYAGFARDRGLATPMDPAEEAAARFQKHLSVVDSWLLVLDNADVPDEVRPLLPTSATGHVIITTRARVSGFGRDLPVDVWSLDQATDFLLDRTDRGAEERAVARELADALGCLPLALEQAGAFLAHRQAPMADYLASFRKRRLDLVEEWPPEHGEYHATVATTWDISFQKMEEASPAAAEAMWACAFLAPDDIPMELFVSTGDLLGPALGELAEAAAEDPLVAHNLVEQLTRYSLAIFDRNERCLSVHRLVQEVIRRRLQIEGRDKGLLEKVHQALDSRFPQDPGTPASWPVGALWLPHVQGVLAAWRNLAEEPTWNPTVLWNRASWYAWAAGIALASRELSEEALSVCRRVLGEEHPSTLASMSNLAATLSDLGDTAGAHELEEKALPVRRRVLGEEHPDTLISMSNLAATLRALGDAAKARPLHEKVLSVRRRVLGEEHADTLISMGNLAVTLRELGDAAGARVLEEEVLSVRRRVLGEEDRNTLRSMNNLAVTLGELEDAAGARVLEEEVLSVRRRVLGEEHPDTLTSMNNLAATLRTLGDAAGARELAEEVLLVSRRVLGKEHPDTLLSMHNLCALLAETEGMEVDHQLVEELLVGVRKLPEKTPIRMAAEARWAVADKSKAR